MSRLFSVVIAGRPNVGKSTLYNRLLGRRKALVHDQPGVTRDLNVAVAERDGEAVQLVDTGGIFGEREDRLLALVEEQVQVALEGGDLVLLLVDGKEGLNPVDGEIARRLLQAGKRAALVVNKVDVEEHRSRAADFYSLGLHPVFTVSAEHGGGTEELWDFLVAQAREAGAATEAETAPGDVIRVAIVGRPNVGKSSLLNRILGSRRALVSEIPGTTRDPVDAPVSMGGRDFLLLDTAGIRRKSKTERGAEILSVILARRSLETCHVALLVLDATEKPSHQDAHIAGLLERSRRAGIVVLNKWDLLGGEERARQVEEAVRERFAFIPYLPLLRVSAKTGRHVDRLLPEAARVYDNFRRKIPTSALNEVVRDLVARVSPPAIQGKELKVRYAVQTGEAPPIVTIFTNSRFPPPEAYSRYLKNGLRGAFGFEGSPLLVKYRKE
ncbi:MAG: ribosome biogenesis GTPase Der [Acidobacteriota bacterium]